MSAIRTCSNTVEQKAENKCKQRIAGEIGISEISGNG